MTRPLLLFAPGAGAPSSHPWMLHWKQLLQTIGEVEIFDYPYMLEGRARPDRMPDLIETHRHALRGAKQKWPEAPTFLVGKSMGGRIGCHLSLEEKVTGLICLGYPLCGGGDRKKMRDQVLRALTTPILFVQGTRDTLCPLDLLAEVRDQMTIRNLLHLVEEGDHSLAVRKRALAATHQTKEDIDRQILARIASFISSF